MASFPSQVYKKDHSFSKKDRKKREVLSKDWMIKACTCFSACLKPDTDSQGLTQLTLLDLIGGDHRKQIMEGFFFFLFLIGTASLQDLVYRRVYILEPTLLI